MQKMKLLSYKTKHFTFIHVNFNSSQKSIECVNSIISNINDNYQIFIVDNNSIISEKDKLNNWNIENGNKINIVWLEDNIGYFPAISFIFKKYFYALKNTDFLIIGNNDLIFKSNFFSILSNTNYNNDIYAISPSVINNNGIKQNPHILVRYSYIQLIFLEIYYFNYAFALIINFISSFLKLRGSQNNKQGHDKSQYISIGYGAVYVLTKSFIFNVKYIPDYLFLMNEECALSKAIFDNEGRIYYHKELVVYHKEHSTIELFPNKKIYQIAKNSHKIAKNYFSNSKIFDKKLL